MRKRLWWLIILVALIILPLWACSAGDPLTDSLYVKGGLYVWNGTAWVEVIGSGVGNVVADANITDNSVVRGDGGAKKVQDSFVTINDFGTIDAPAMTVGNLQATGKVEGDRLIGDVEGYSIDVVQASDLNIALDDTLSLVFLFVPDVIEISYSGRIQHDVTLDDGHTTGHSLVEITGVNTMTCNTNYTAFINNGGAFGSRFGQNNNVSTIVLYGGNDGVDDSYIYGVGTWTTATKTLLLTFSTVANTNDATSYVEIMAIAYR